MESKEVREKVYVFGSNLRGFHGAGTAGMAMRGESKNTWRHDERFLKAMKAPIGHEDRVGLRAIYGIAEGLQQGTLGKGWAIPTVTRPGARRSISLKNIKNSIKKLWIYASEHPEYDFIYTPLGCGYAGYKPAEMFKIISELLEELELPKNLHHIKTVYKDVLKIDNADT